VPTILSLTPSMEILLNSTGRTDYNNRLTDCYECSRR
jgi:hypothetical protein